MITTTCHAIRRNGIVLLYVTMSRCTSSCQIWLVRRYIRHGVWYNSISCCARTSLCHGVRQYAMLYQFVIMSQLYVSMPCCTSTPVYHMVALCGVRRLSVERRLLIPVGYADVGWRLQQRGVRLIFAETPLCIRVPRTQGSS